MVCIKANTKEQKLKFIKAIKEKGGVDLPLFFPLTFLTVFSYHPWNYRRVTIMPETTGALLKTYHRNQLQNHKAVCLLQTALVLDLYRSEFIYESLMAQICPVFD